MGAFGSDSNSRKTENILSGPVTASEGSTAYAIIAGNNSVLPGGTLYKVAKGGSINLTVSQTAPSGAGTLLAGAIERQAGAALGTPSEASGAYAGGGETFDKKTLIVGAIVAAVLLAVLWFARRT